MGNCDNNDPSGFGLDAGLMTIVRMKITRDKVNGTFDFSTTLAEAGEYRLCWCQGSFRPCTTAAEFSFDIGRLTVAAAEYVWPACAALETAFTGWRTWQTFDDCCCNFQEAGAVGCTDKRTVAWRKCSQLPLR